MGKFPATGSQGQAGKQNPDMVLDIQRGIAEFYGYSGLEAAEQALAGRDGERQSQ